MNSASELPEFVAKLEAWRLKMFHNILFLQSDMVFGILIPFPEYLMLFLVRKLSLLRCFSCSLTFNSGQ